MQELIIVVLSSVMDVSGTTRAFVIVMRAKDLQGCEEAADAALTITVTVLVVAVVADGTV